MDAIVIMDNVEEPEGNIADHVLLGILRHKVL